MMGIRSFDLWVIGGEYLLHRSGLVQKLFFVMHLHLHLYICCHSIDTDDRACEGGQGRAALVSLLSAPGSLAATLRSG